MKNLDDRHPATVHLARYFAYDHLPTTSMQDISRSCARLAEHMIEMLDDDPELTAGLRKLLEAKDCFFRAALDIPRGA